VRPRPGSCLGEQPPFRRVEGALVLRSTRECTLQVIFASPSYFQFHVFLLISAAGSRCRELHRPVRGGELQRARDDPRLRDALRLHGAAAGDALLLPHPRSQPPHARRGRERARLRRRDARSAPGDPRDESARDEQGQRHRRPRGRVGGARMGRAGARRRARRALHDCILAAVGRGVPAAGHRGQLPLVQGVWHAVHGHERHRDGAAPRDAILLLGAVWEPQRLRARGLQRARPCRDEQAARPGHVSARDLHHGHDHHALVEQSRVAGAGQDAPRVPRAGDGCARTGGVLVHDAVRGVSRDQDVAGAVRGVLVPLQRVHRCAPHPCHALLPRART